MSFLRTNPSERKNYSVGKKRTKMVLELMDAVRAAACAPPDTPQAEVDGLERRVRQARRSLMYSIGKLEHKAMETRRENVFLKNRKNSDE